MKTKARVILIRKSTGMVAAETSSGSVTVFELLVREPIMSGDILSGYPDELGIQSVYNETRDEELQIFVHEHGLSVDEAIERHFAQSLGSSRRPMWPIRLNPTLASGISPLEK